MIHLLPPSSKTSIYVAAIAGLLSLVYRDPFIEIHAVARSGIVMLELVGFMRWFCLSRRANVFRGWFWISPVQLHDFGTRH